MLNDFTLWLARKIAVRGAKIINRRPPDQEIGDEEIYLSRWHVVPRNPILNVYLHLFWKDDDDRALHDHPWSSVSLSLGRMESDGRVYQDADACLWEEYLDRAGAVNVRRIPCGTMVYRSSTFAHRLIVPTRGVMTLFVTGPRIRSWGFWCGSRWVHWKTFTGYADGRPGQIGRGCD